MNSNTSQMSTMMDAASASSFSSKVAVFFGTTGRWADFLQPFLALTLRVYVSWQFLKSGWLKITDWEQTLGLFDTEYHVPLLPPHFAAVVGTFGELFFPILLILGLGGRLTPLGLFAVNAMAVISYAHVLLADGFEAALAQHVLWGTMLVVLIVYGQGVLSLDRLWSWRHRKDSGMTW